MSELPEEHTLRTVNSLHNENLRLRRVIEVLRVGLKLCAHPTEDDGFMALSIYAQDSLLRAEEIEKEEK